MNCVQRGLMRTTSLSVSATAAFALMLVACLLPGLAASQEAPTGDHYGGRPSDTGFQPDSVSAAGNLAASVPLDLPPARGGLPVPLQVVFTGRGVGAAGLGWDIPLSYVRQNTTFQRRRPRMDSDVAPAPRETVTLSLPGRTVELIPKGTDWIPRYGAPDLVARLQNAQWLVYDGNGLTYTFISNNLLSGSGIWYLRTITGPGGSQVALKLRIEPAPLPGGGNGVKVQLDKISYNFHPTTANCAKNDISLSYEEAPAPLSVSVVGSVVLVRTNKLSVVDVRGSPACGTSHSIRRYVFTPYAVDPDTLLPRLNQVVAFGTEGTQEAKTALPIVSYGYGSVTGAGRPAYQWTQSIPLPPMADAAQISSTVEAGVPATPTGRSAGMFQGLTDVTGDGRPDLVFKVGTSLWVAPNLPGTTPGTTVFGTAVPLTDATFADGPFETRSSNASRFDVQPQLAHYDYVWRKAIDMNGDGRIDIVDAAEEQGRWVIYLNTPGPGPSGVTWVRRSITMETVFQHLSQSVNLPAFVGHYVPLTGRFTGKDYTHGACWRWNGTSWQPYPDGFSNGLCRDVPNLITGVQAEHTITEWDLADVNGDGYPDILFNRNRVDIVGEGPPDVPGQQVGAIVDGNQQFTVKPTEPGGVPNQLNAMLNVRGVALQDDFPYSSFSKPITLTDAGSCGIRNWTSSGSGFQQVICDIADVNGDGLADRVEGQIVHLGTGNAFSTATIALPGAFATQVSPGRSLACAGATGAFLTSQLSGLRDVNGDGIPDFIDMNASKVAMGTGTGFAPPVAFDGAFGLSVELEQCDGSSSATLDGLYDIDGDGQPELVALNEGARTLDVFQLESGGRPGVPEAGRIIQIDNGYGAKTTVGYRSAKEDVVTAHQDPSPEIVVTSVETTGTLGLGGSTAATTYAYGGAEMVFDPWVDGFFMPGYARSITQRTVLSPFGRAQGIAVVTDTYPLEEFISFSFPPAADRVARYLRAGRVRDVTAVVAPGSDVWRLLSLDVATDSRRIGASHHEFAMQLVKDPTPSNVANPLECFEVMFPYDWNLSVENNFGDFAFCGGHGFLYENVTTEWRGDEAPPSARNVETRTQVLAVDDFGRDLKVLYQNDTSRGDDDLCVVTTFADPMAAAPRVLSAVAERRLTDCFEATGTWARETTQFDGLPSGVSSGFPTRHSVDVCDADGTCSGTIRAFDATYDAFGNPLAVTTQREDGAFRTSSFDYDIFALAPVHARTTATAVPPLDTSLTLDPLTLDVLATTDANLTRRGTELDGYGRLSRETITPPGGASGVLATASYLGFTGVDPLGRRVVVTRFADPVAPANVGTAAGRVATAFLDEIGRPRRTEIALGASYGGQVLVAGMRRYDAFGRVAFAADPFPTTQDPATSYGTTYLYLPNGDPSCVIRGRGPQPLTQTTDDAIELYPTCFNRTFANRQETVTVSEPDSLAGGTSQSGVARSTTTTAIGRLVERRTVRTTLGSSMVLELATFDQDRLGHTTSITRYLEPNGRSGPVTASSRFDSLGRLVEQNDDPESATRFFTYSDWGELIQAQWTDTTSAPTTDRRMLADYDARGRILHREEQTGGTRDSETFDDYFYDVGIPVGPEVTPTFVLGRLSEARSPGGQVNFSYDAFGRPNAQSFLDSDGSRYVAKRAFRGDGALATIDLLLPDTGYRAEHVDYGYDSAARLRTMKFTDGQTSRDLFNAADTDAWGRLRQGKLGGVVDYAATWADQGRRLLGDASFTTPSGSRKITWLGYDPIGRERSRREVIDGAATGPTTSFTYDEIGRLAGAVRTAGASTQMSWQYHYDPLGNLTQATDLVGTADAAVTMRTADRDRLCRIFYGDSGFGGTGCNVSYDGAGNVVEQPTRTGHRTMTWFASGRVRGVTDGAIEAAYRYDALGGVQALDLEGPGQADARHDRHYGEMIERRDRLVGGVQTPFLSRQIPGPAGMVVSRRGPGNDWIFQLGEVRGNRYFVDGNGAFVQTIDYQPFGEATSTGAQPGTATYTSEQWNGGDALAALGVSQLGARLYDPVIGRFLSRDPMRIMRTAATSHPYAFAANDPVNSSDASGLDCTGPECRPPPGGGHFPGEGPGQINDPTLYVPLRKEPSGNLTWDWDAARCRDPVSIVFDEHEMDPNRIRPPAKRLSAPGADLPEDSITVGIWALNAKQMDLFYSATTFNNARSSEASALFALEAQMLGGSQRTVAMVSIGGGIAGGLALGGMRVGGVPRGPPEGGQLGGGSPGRGPDLVYRAPRREAHTGPPNPGAARTPGEHVWGRGEGRDYLTHSPFESWTSDRAVAEWFARQRGTQVEVLDLSTVDPSRIAADLRTAAGREGAAAREVEDGLKRIILDNMDDEVILWRK